MGVFHRYRSEIHGNWRRACLRAGLAAGVLMALYVLVRLLMRTPMESPMSLVVDAILLVLVFLLTAWYRNGLPDKRITLKEAMLFGIGTATVAAVVYGLLLWAIGLAAPQQTTLFTQTMTPTPAPSAGQPQAYPPNHPYWAAWWAIVAGLETLILGAFGSLVAAIVLRNEKPK